MSPLQIGTRVEVNGKGIQGVVAFIGIPLFSRDGGTWVGIILDEPKGKNNGTVQGKKYFQCEENHGLFVKIHYLSYFDESGNKIDLSKTSSTDDLTPKTTPVASGISMGLRSRFGSSRTSVGRASYSKSREDINTPIDIDSKRSSFVERASASALTTPKFRSKLRPSIAKSLTNLAKPKTSIESPTKKTGFVENLKPQFTPGNVLMSPVVQTQKTPQLPSIDPVEYEALKSQVQDLNEKLETIRIKHKEKMHEIDSMHIKLDQAAEFKIKIMESQASLKKELEQVKKEKDEILESREDLTDLTDALEMATLDKEMAEEKVEALQLELTDVKEKLEEITLDFEIMKAELEKTGSSVAGEGDGGASSYQMKQLEQQNLRLRETLVRMRDLSAHEKHEAQKLQKDLEDKKAEYTELRKTADKQQIRIAEMEKMVAELHEQVDAALGAEEMVENLGLQKLALEDKIKELEEAVNDLEALQDINDQLQEDSRDLETQLREEVDLANAATREAKREKEDALEALTDRELTIVKFRDLVQKLQDQCQELQTQLQRENSAHDSMKVSIPEMLDFKKMFADTRAQARAIDLELRRMEVIQAQQHLQYMVAFMPESFLTRGGDNDAVLTLMLVTRLQLKCEVLISQIKDKFPSVELSNKGELVNGHTAEQYASRCRLTYHLFLLQAILRQFKYGLDTCSTDVLMKTAASYPEISQQEKVLDGYIELLKSDKLDENVGTDSIEKCNTYFYTMHTLLLYSSGEKCVHECRFLLDYTIAFTTACDGIRTDVAIVQALIQEDDTSDMSPLCQHLSTVAEVMQQHLKQIRRRLTGFPDAKVLPIPELTTSLMKIGMTAKKIITALREISKTAFSQIALTTDDIHISSDKLLEIYNAVGEKNFDEACKQGVIACLKNAMNYFANEIANIAQAMQEAETHLSTAELNQDKPIQPIYVRANEVKKELEQTKTLQSKLENKDVDIKELKMQLKNKMEEIGELNIRKDLAEKKSINSETKLANTVRDYDLNVEKLQRKLDEANQLMKRKEAEFEATMDHLQADIDSLESEKGELKDKLKSFSKKALIDVVKSANVSLAANHSSDNVPHTSPSGNVSDSPLLINEIKALKVMLREERIARSKVEASHYQKMLNDLEPIPLFKQDSEIDPNILELEKKIKQLNNDVISITSLPTVVDISKNNKVKKLPISQLQDHNNKRNTLNRRILNLQNEYTKLAMKKRTGSQIITDLTTFPTPEAKKMLTKNPMRKIGTLTVPCGVEFPKPTKIDMPVDINDFNTLMKSLTSFLS